MTFVAASAVLAGIVAKGLGAIAIIFVLGLIVGVMLTVTVTSKVRGIRRAARRTACVQSLGLWPRRGVRHDRDCSPKTCR